ncbi:MAG: FtsX-like permease family protein [Nitrososphaerota archaeon]|jgi:ABC-type antimicrobial peptide transport system permease subunit|nr:FtsX-like permease family protein [Nitrososphaerota archaeon]
MMDILTRATKNLYRKRTRTLIVVIALTLALTLLVVLPPSINERADLTQQAIDDFVAYNKIVAADLTLSATEIKCEYGLNLDEVIGNIDGSVSLSPKLLNQSLCHAIGSLPDVNTVIPVLECWGTASHPYTIYGIPLSDSSYLNNKNILPVNNITAGRNLQVGDSGVIVVDEYVAKDFRFNSVYETSEDYEADIAKFVTKAYVFNVGDSFDVLGRSFTVVGIEGGALTQGSHGVTMSLEDAQSVTGKFGQASKYLVFVDDVDSVGSVVARIQNLDSKLLISAGYLQLNVASELLRQLDDLTNSAQNNLDNIQGIGTVEIALAVVVVMVVILFMMLYSVRERTKEIGTLKAMGASNSTILGQFMLEGMLLCLIAVVFAIVIGMFVMPPVSNALLPTPISTFPALSFYPNGTRYLTEDSCVGVSTASASVTLELALFVVGLALLLSALGSLYPALKAARTKPAEAMRYE